MITDKLNTGLIAAMRDKLPRGANLANTLMDILFIGKEAVYRRLRGEVPFTLAEAVMVQQRLGISLDRIGGMSFAGNAMFNLDMLHHEDPIETYYAAINSYAELFDRYKDLPDSELATSSNMIPQTFYLKYGLLSKFRLFKWMYQHEKIDCGESKCIEDLVLPEKLLARQREYVALTQHIRSTCYVWDELLFFYLVNDIRYFIGINLMTDATKEQLKTELLELFDELEEIATRGRFSTGNDVQIYISNINFEATYSYVAAKTDHLSLIRVYGINSITSVDEAVFRDIREWIQSLKKFVTLISQSG